MAVPPPPPLNQPITASASSLTGPEPKTNRDLLLRGRSLTLPDANEARRYVLRIPFVQGKDIEIALSLDAYFRAVRDTWPGAWDKFGQGFVLNKTNGFRALMRLFREVFNDRYGPGNVVKYDHVQAVLARSSLKDADFVTENYPPGTSGEGALFRALRDTCRLAVSTTFGDGLDARLPMVGLFNHVVVRASLAGRTYWLDGTRTGDSSLDRLKVPDFGWGLPLIATGAALVRMMPAPLEVPGQDTSIRIDASAGISAPAPTKIETILRGDEAVGTNMALANLVGEARTRALKDYWKNQYDFIDVKVTSASFDPKTGEQRLSMEGEAKLDWANGNYQTDGTNVGYRADFSRDPGPDKDAPFAVAYPYYNRTREMIILPKGSGDFKVGTGMDVDQRAGGVEYKRHATIADGVFTAPPPCARYPRSDAAGRTA